MQQMLGKESIIFNPRQLNSLLQTYPKSIVFFIYNVIVGNKLASVKENRMFFHCRAKKDGY
jgi:hypothetical protein